MEDFDAIFIRSMSDPCAWIAAAGVEAFVGDRQTYSEGATLIRPFDSRDLIRQIAIRRSHWTFVLSSNASNITARISQEIECVAVHNVKVGGSWAFAIYSMGEVVCAYKADWSKRKVVIDRSRLKIEVLEELVGIGAGVEPSGLCGSQWYDLLAWLSSSDWRNVGSDEAPEELFASVMGMPNVDGLSFQTVKEFYEDDPDTFRLMHPNLSPFGIH